MAWWTQRTPRERLVLAVGGVALALILLLGLVWAPLQDSIDRRQAALAAQQDTLQWMNEVAAELPQLRPHGGASGPPATALLSLLESSARQRGLRQRITRMEPQGEGSVRVNLREVGFDATMQWLAQLQAAGVYLREGQFVLADGPGSVNVSLTLQR